MRGMFVALSKLLVGHPFDTVKVRQQALGDTTKHFASPLTTLKYTITREGPLALYKGASPQLPGLLVYNTLLYGCFDSSLRLLDWQSPLAATKDGWTPLHRVAQAGVCVGLVTGICVSPFELLRARCQVQHGSAQLQEGVIASMKRQVRELGLVKGMFRGTLAMTMRETFGNAVFFGSYEAMLRNVWGVSSLDSTRRPSALSAFIAGGVAGSVNWLAIYPIDTVKNRMQADDPSRPVFKNMRHCFRTVWEGANGWRGLYAGLSPCLLRGFVANGAGFVAIEMSRRAESAVSLRLQHR
ncbi:MAG: hypothetical protein MHM6MM_008552 [Cercozoa sp. M6MM]